MSRQILFIWLCPKCLRFELASAVRNCSGWFRTAEEDREDSEVKAPIIHGRITPSFKYLVDPDNRVTHIIARKKNIFLRPWEVEMT